MRTLDFFGSFIGVVRLTPESPFIHAFELSEYDGKCRNSTAIFVRLLPFRTALVFGRWHATGLTPSEAVSQLVEMNAERSAPQLFDATGNLDPRFAPAVRAQIAAHAQDPDEEWQILEMTGLAE